MTSSSTVLNSKLKMTSAVSAASNPRHDQPPKTPISCLSAPLRRRLAPRFPVKKRNTQIPIKTPLPESPSPATLCLRELYVCGWWEARSWPADVGCWTLQGC